MKIYSDKTEERAIIKCHKCGMIFLIDAISYETDLDGEKKYYIFAEQTCKSGKCYCFYCGAKLKPKDTI